MTIIKSCLTCRFHGKPVSELDPKKEPRPCAHCIARSGFSRWECAEQYKSEDNIVPD
jgi:hypothetical protein